MRLEISYKKWGYISNRDGYREHCPPIAKSQEDSLEARIKDMLTKIEGAYCLIIQSRSKMFVIEIDLGYAL